MFNRFLNKRKSLTVQTSLLIILVITVALVISTMLFYYKADMELTVHYRDQMFQESNITMNALSDNIDSIDSIYRLLISNDTIYGFMTSSSKKPSDYIAAEKQMTSILILNNIWEKNYLRSVYVYTNNKKKFYVSKEDNIITTEENAAVYRNLTEPSPTLTLHTLDTSNDLYFVRTIYNISSGEVIGTMIITINQKEWVNMLTRNITKGWHILMYNNNFETISDYNYDDKSKENIENLKESLDYYNDTVFHQVNFQSMDYLTLSNKLRKVDISATIMAPKSQISRQVNEVLNSYIIVVILIVVLVVMIAFAISRYITRPIGTMINSIKQISNGNYSEKVTGLEEYEEFYYLQVAINDMLDQIHSYHNNVLEQNISLKTAEIKALQSQLNPHFIFNVLNTLTWKAEMSDKHETNSIGSLATVTASSENSSDSRWDDQSVVKAVDGVADGYATGLANLHTRFPWAEWATKNEGAGAWLSLAYDEVQKVTKIKIYDRPNTDDHITNSHLEFDDGTTLEVGELPNDGSVKEISLGEGKEVKNIKFVVDEVSESTTAVGLAEIEVIK